MSLIDNLATIREMQGKEPLPNPHVIQGFEPGSAPVPPYTPIRHEEPMSNEDDEFGINDEPEAPSPLIPRRRSGSETLAAPAHPVIEPTLAVIDSIASWKGRPVVLNEADVRSVKAVVLKAIQRELNADMAGLVKRRDRKPKEAASSPAKAGAKRGRKA